MVRRGNCNAELLDMYGDEEEFWHRRVGENWLLKGDNNTEYFHRIAAGRRRKNIIYTLNKDEGGGGC